MIAAGDIYWCWLRSPKATKGRLLQVKAHPYAGQNRRERLVTSNAIGSLSLCNTHLGHSELAGRLRAFRGRGPDNLRNDINLLTNSR